MLCVTQVFAQNRTVTGTVTAKEDGLPIPGVTVKIKGGTGGTQTNSAGKFSLSVPANATLEFSGVGYTKVSAPVKGDVLNVSLATASNQLGEVVITGALGIKSQARQLGYATAQIDNKALTQAKVTDVSTGLQGKVSGLQVNLTNNGVNPTTRIVLRGNRSITGNNQALIVVDGVPNDNPNYITTINPEDIASVTVLKGAVAAAIYGSKASNGVLIITTKKGSKGKPSITIQNTTEIQSVSYLPALQTKFGGYGGEGGAFVNPDGTVNPVPYENESYGPAFDGRKLGIALSPKFASDGVTVIGYDTLFSAYSNKPNNRRDFFNNGISNLFNVSYDIGSDNSTMHVGFQDNDIKGITPNDTRRQDNIRIGGTQTYGKFSVEYNASYNQNAVSQAGPSYNQTSGGLTGDLLYFEVLNTPANIPLQDFKNINSQYGNVNSYYNAYATNPYWTVANSRNNSTSYIFSGNVNLSYKATNWLTFSDRLAITSNTQQILQTRQGVQFAPWAIADPQSAGNVPSSLGSVFPATLDQTFFEQLLNNDFIANFNKKFGKFNLSGVVGVNTQQSYQRELSLEGDQLQFPGDFNITSTLGIPTYNEFYYKQRSGGIYEEATLGYNNYLFLHVTNRDEWNSVLSQAHNHYEYPGADGSFVFTDGIKSLKDNNVLSYGKIHAGVAQVANINIGGLNTNPYGAYSLVNPFVPATGFPFGSLGGYSQSALSLNPNIKPEQTLEYEGGVELGFLKDRIKFETTISHSESKNQSLTSSVSSATGFTQEIANAGLVTNDVQEFDLSLIPVQSRNFTWTVGINFTHYANKVVSLSGGQHQLQIGNNAANTVGAVAGIYAVVGKPFPIIETNDWIRDPASGKVIVDAGTGQPTPNPNLTEYGTTNPTYQWGFNSTLTYKSLSFSFVIDYRGGNEIFNSTASVEAFTGISAQSAQNGRQRFIFPNSVVASPGGGFVNNTSVAVNNGNGGQPSSFWANIYGQPVGSLFVEDAAFIKLREANLTFQLPASIVKSIGFIKKASIGLIGRNLLMIRPKSNDSIDPEFADTTGNGIGTTSVSQLPPTRFYGANLSVSF
jgi:TonB-linked SusC/RagA family outer membrane protein